MYETAVIIVAGLFALHRPRNCIRSSNHRFRASTKSVLQIHESDQLFVDESGASWQAFSESLGFCNQVYTSVDDSVGANQPNTMKMMKIYSDLAMQRIQLSGNQHFDQIMGDLGIGPTIFNSTEKYVIMEELIGRVLSNEDLLTPSSMHLQNVSRMLAKLHCVQRLNENDGRENMLWSCCNALLEQLQGHSEKLYQIYSSQLKHQQLVLEDLDLPVVLGHGDFKPSNVIVLSDSGEARLIDWETCGCHYRAYDLAKFFRAVEPYTSEGHQWLSKNRFAFVKNYCEDMGATLGVSAEDPTWVSLESQLLLPMTWLEAALFFQCKSYDEGSDLDVYTHYAEQRLRSYKKSLKQWEKDLNKYNRLR